MFGTIGSVIGYCTFCDAEATQVSETIKDDDGEPTRFCYTCYQAFQLGQRFPETEEIDAEDELIPLTCPTCRREEIQSMEDYEWGAEVFCPNCGNGETSKMLNRRELAEFDHAMEDEIGKGTQ